MSLEPPSNRTESKLSSFFLFFGSGGDAPALQRFRPDHAFLMNCSRLGAGTALRQHGVDQAAVASVTTAHDMHDIQYSERHTKMMQLQP